MWHLERANRRLPVRWYSLLGVILVPILIAAGVLGATWNADARLRKVEAAVVNLDEAVTIKGQIVPLGRQLTAALVDRQKEQNFTWVLADEKHAQDGLASGRFAAVVTIPKDFSAAATSFSANKADQTRQATITIAPSQITGIADSVLAQVIARSAVDTLNRTLTASYLENVYIGFNDTGKQLLTVSDAARQLADGSTKLSNGVGDAAKGTGDLAAGLNTLATKGTELKNGAGQISSGAHQLAGGLNTMKTKTAGLPGGTRQLSDGAAKYAAGVRQYAGGVIQVAAGSEKLAAGTKQYATGVNQYVDGTNQLLGGIGGLVAALPDLVSGLKSLATGANQVAGGADGLAAGATQLSNGVGAYRGAMGQIAQGKSGGQTIPCPAQLKATAGGCDGFYAGLAYAGGAAVQGSADLVTGASGLATGASQVAGGARGVASGAQTIVTGLGPLSQGGADKLPGAVSQLKTAGAKLKAGSAQVSSGTSALASGLRKLSGPADGKGGKDGNSKQIIAGAAGLASGAKKIADGMPALVSGIGQAAAGADKLATGANTYANGVGAYVNGVAAASSGASQLKSGLDQLGSGGKELASGAGKLADGLAKGAKQVPNYSESDRKTLSDAVSSPIQTDNLDRIVDPAVAWVSLLLVIALWLGALATYALVQAVRSDAVLSSASSTRLLLASLMPGLAIAAAQVVSVGAFGALVLGLPFAKAAAVVALLLVVGVVFVAVNHALTAWFRGAGRVASVVFAVVTAASALTYAAPGWLDAIRPFSPLSPALDAVRAVITDGPGLGGSLITLAGWLACSLAASAAATMRSRRATLATLPV